MLNIYKLKKKNKNSVNFDKINVNTVGQTRHYPPASKEWFNSIYAYKKDTTKCLPNTDTVIIKLIRSYFNLYSRKLEKKVKSPRMRTWMRRLSTDRILVSRAEVKHTGEKVYITLYLYNRQKIYIINKIKKIRLFLFNISNLLNFLKNKNLKKLKKKLNKRNLRSLINKRNLKYLKIRKTLRYFKNKRNLRYFKNKRSFKNRKLNNWQKFKSLVKYRKRNLKIFKIKMAFIKAKSLDIISKVRNEKDLFLSPLGWDNKNFKNYEKIYRFRFLKKSLEKEITYFYYKQILFLNKDKFKNSYLLPLKALIKLIYNKKVYFNLISLKYFHLNSDIFTQILISKVRNRKNRVLKVLKKSLRAIRLPFLNKFSILDEIYNRKRKLQNVIVKNLALKPALETNKYKIDALDNILESYLPVNLKKEFTEYLKNIIIKNKVLKNKEKTIFINFLINNLLKKPLKPVLKKEYDNFYKNTVLNSLKHKVVNGIRIEASGRLTRRIVAARSIFKLRYIGSLKNTDSSIKGFSSVILRGHFKSNLQHTKLSSKRRIGSFGIKGWINSN